MIEASNVDGINSVDLRRSWFEADRGTAAIEDRVAARGWPSTFTQSEDFRWLHAELDYLDDYTRVWARAPYHPFSSLWGTSNYSIFCSISVKTSRFQFVSGIDPVIFRYRASFFKPNRLAFTASYPFRVSKGLHPSDLEIAEPL